MIKVEDLIYGIDLKLNKVAGLVHQSIPIEDKIIALNNAQVKLVIKKVDPLNQLQVGFDGDKKRYEDLQILVEPASKHKLPITEEDKELHRWVSDVSNLTPNYMFFVDGYLLADKGACKGRRVNLNSKLTKHGSVTTLLENPSYCPSFEYQETLCTFSSNKIETYTDGTFIPTTLYLSYIRRPLKIDFEGYVNFDGSDSEHSDCELAFYLQEELLDLTILELGIETENPTVTQAAPLRSSLEE